MAKKHKGAWLVISQTLRGAAGGEPADPAAGGSARGRSTQQAGP